VRGCALTIGSFDGLHIGHQALIARTLVHARELRVPAMMVSFEPLPREFLKPGDPPARLTNFRERWRLLERSGLDAVWLLPFDAQLRGMSGTAFMQLLQSAGAQRVVVGHDFRFGHKGEANASWCKESAGEFGFAVDVVAPVVAHVAPDPAAAERVSSGGVRVALAAGDLTLAAQLLGRRYTMRGRVRRGAQLGRQLGYATANVAVQRRRVPLDGIFAVRVSGAGLDAWPGVASLGTRPTVNGIEPLLETHLFGFDGDLYGREIEVEFVQRLRAELKFDSVAAMVQQIHQDAAAARRILGLQDLS
jgi:riboflavin kinase/FMN adenylyltransferase